MWFSFGCPFWFSCCWCYTTISVHRKRLPHWLFLGFFHIEYCISLLDSLVFDKSSVCFSSLSSLYKCNRFIRFSSHTRFHSSFIFLCLNIFTLFYVHSQSNLLFLSIHSNSNSWIVPFATSWLFICYVNCWH